MIRLRLGADSVSCVDPTSIPGYERNHPGQASRLARRLPRRPKSVRHHIIFPYAYSDLPTLLASPHRRTNRQTSQPLRNPNHLSPPSSLPSLRLSLRVVSCPRRVDCRRGLRRRGGILFRETRFRMHRISTGRWLCTSRRGEWRWRLYHYEHGIC